MSGDILKGDLGLSLMNLGYTSESLANSTNNYIALQNQLGRVQLKTATQLRTEATAYAFELDKLTRLTGLSREDMEKRQRSLMSDERYAGFMATEAKRQGYDTDKLNNFFSLIEDESTRKGLQHMLAGGGVGNSEEARRIMMTDPMAYERMMRVARGGSAINEVAGFYGQSKQYMGGMGGELARYGGTGPGIALGSNLADAERYSQMVAAAREKGYQSLEEFVKTEQGKAMMDKAELERQNKLRLQQLGAAQTLDSTVKQFGFLNKITATLSETFTNVIKKLGGSVAGGTPSATGPGAAQGLAGLREMIAAKESGGNYNVMVGGQTADLTNMTIAQVMELQKSRIAGGQGSAAGKYQIINKTLEGLIKEGNIDTSSKFDQRMQDRLADMLIQRRGYGDYQSGKISKEQFGKNLSQEWAALPSGPGNQSYYAGVGNNKAGMTWDQVMQSLNPGVTGTTSGPASGFSPNLQPMASELARYGGNSSMAAAAQAEFRADTKSTAQLITKIDELIDVNRAMLGTSQRILRYAQ
jgi:muramidase (phage lysozyme)